jgi:AcrR family transcriptional regulator
MNGLRERGKARRKERILQAAKRLLAEGGIEALSARKLAAEAEVSVRTLYALVGSKAQVLEAVMQQNHDRVLADMLDFDEQHPIDRMFAFVDSTYRIIAEDVAAQKALMRVLMTLYYEGRLSPHPWWLLSTEKSWMDGAVVDATRRRVLLDDFAPGLIGDLLMKIYLANLRDFLFDKCSLTSFRERTEFDFCCVLAGAATPRHRRAFVERSIAIARRLNSARAAR